VLAFGSLLLPAARALAANWYPGAGRTYSVALAIVGLMALADAVLNSFFFYPAILAAAAAAFPLPAPKTLYFR